MVYKLNGRNITVPDAELEKFVGTIAETKEEALEIWLDDHGYAENKEQEALEQRAKHIRIDHDAAGGAGKGSGGKKPVSVEKQSLFAELLAFSQKYCENNGGTCLILKDNKLIEVKIDGKSFKIDLIESRKKL